LLFAMYGMMPGCVENFSLSCALRCTTNSRVTLCFNCYYSIDGEREEGDRGAAVDVVK
jgi:hypothetical protein